MQRVRDLKPVDLLAFAEPVVNQRLLNIICVEFRPQAFNRSAKVGREGLTARFAIPVRRPFCAGFLDGIALDHPPDHFECLEAFIAVLKDLLAQLLVLCVIHDCHIVSPKGLGCQASSVVGSGRECVEVVGSGAEWYGLGKMGAFSL